MANISLSISHFSTLELEYRVCVNQGKTQALKIFQMYSCIFKSLCSFRQRIPPLLLSTHPYIKASAALAQSEKISPLWIAPKYPRDGIRVPLESQKQDFLSPKPLDRGTNEAQQSLGPVALSPNPWGPQGEALMPPLPVPVPRRAPCPGPSFRSLE